jgi:hypothetical protein
MTPVLIEVVAPTLAGFQPGCFGCRFMFREVGLNHMERAFSSDEYPEEFQEEAGKLSACLMEISRLYKHRVRIRLIDPLSPLGLWKRLRHRFREMPAFIVDRRIACSGFDQAGIEELIDRRIQELSG